MRALASATRNAAGSKADDGGLRRNAARAATNVQPVLPTPRTAPTAMTGRIRGFDDGCFALNQVCNVCFWPKAAVLIARSDV